MVDHFHNKISFDHTQNSTEESIFGKKMCQICALPGSWASRLGFDSEDILDSGVRACLEYVLVLWGVLGIFCIS
jgi:hypothetical protein